MLIAIPVFEGVTALDAARTAAGQPKANRGEWAPGTVCRCPTTTNARGGHSG